MIFLIALASVLIFVILFHKTLRAHPTPFYITAVCISFAVVFCTWNHTAFPNFFETRVWPLFARGALAGAFFIIVMFTGAFPNGSKPIKMLMPIRAQLSIIASILTLGHNIAYGKTYFTALFLNPARLSTPTLLAAVCSLIMILIMLPLFITSFKPVRKRMKAKTWKRLQRLAYVFYGLLYCHIMLLTIPNAIQGREGYALTVFVYSLVFISYLFCRVMKAIAIREKTTAVLPRKQAAGILCSAVMSALILISVGNARKTAAVYVELENLRSEIESLQSNLANAAAESRSSGKYKNGTFTGSANGNHGTGRDIEVEVTLENDTIVSIEIIGFRDDEEYFSPTAEGSTMIEAILVKQSPYVDVITGATESSEGLINAVKKALNEAKN